MSVERLEWDNPHLRDNTRRKLMSERVLELTLPPHNKNKNTYDKKDDGCITQKKKPSRQQKHKKQKKKKKN